MAMNTSHRENSTSDVCGGRREMSWWSDVFRRFSRQTVCMIALAVLLLIAASALFAPWLAPSDPSRQFRETGLTEQGQPVSPNASFWLGTDHLGRDLLSRLLWGGRISLQVGLAASGLAVVIALLIGGLSGYAGGTVDFAIMRFVDFMLGIPTFFLMLLLMVVLSPGINVIILVITVFGWAYPARVFRGEVLSIKNRDFVQAARSVGVPGSRIFFRHVLPHLLPLVIVYVALGIPGAIFAEVGLSFVGLGVPAPTASWGSMLNAGIGYYRSAPWILLWPGLAIMATVITVNLVAAGLRDAMDPTRKGR